MSDYSYWQARLAGHNVAPQLDVPQCGFFRDRQDRPVAYYMTGAVPSTLAPLTCVRVDAEGYKVLDEGEARDLWNWVCVNPVTEEAWRAAADGQDWPDGVPGMRHNAPPQDSPEMQRLVLIDTAEMWVKSNPEVATKNAADQASKLIKDLRTEYGALEDEEKEKKKPYQNFVETVRDQYRELRKPIGELGVKIKALLQPWLTAEAKRVEDARLAAIEENRAKQQRGERASAPVPAASAGRRGSKVGLRKFYSAAIADFDRAYRNAKDEYEMKEALQVVANRFARGYKEGMSDAEITATLLPGTKLVTDEKVV